VFCETKIKVSAYDTAGEIYPGDILKLLTFFYNIIVYIRPFAFRKNFFSPVSCSVQVMIFSLFDLSKKGEYSGLSSCFVASFGGK